MDHASGTGTESRQISVLLLVVFLVYLGQMSLNPVIAPLARESGLAEWQVGVTISVAALTVMLCSQFWGRRSQAWGSRRVLSAAIILALLVMIAFTLVARAGMQGLLTGSVLFALFVLLRGIGYGAAISAVAPTAQTHIAGVTEPGQDRVRGMAGIGAAQSIAMVAGSALGGLLAGAVGLLLPIALVPVQLLVALGLVIRLLRKQSRTEVVTVPARISPFDARVWPFLLTCFGMFTAFGSIQVVAGFLVQDRLELDASRTGLLTGAVLLTAGGGMVVAQGLIVPRCGWSPARLLRAGTMTSAVGLLLMVPNNGTWLLLLAAALIGIGLGIATPGCTAGASMVVRDDEQGGLAGLLGAVGGLSFVFSPTASTLLYKVSGLLPIIVAVTIMAVLWVFLMLHPRFRQVDTATQPSS